MALDFDKAMRIWTAISGTTQKDFLDDVIDSAVRYAQARVRYFRATTEQQGAIGAERAQTHDGLIAYINALRNRMAANGENVAWHASFGPMDTLDRRKNIGDFACWLHARFGIMAR